MQPTNNGYDNRPARDVDLLGLAGAPHSSGHSNHGDNPSPVGLADVLAVARRWWWQSLLAGIVSGTAAAAVVLLLFKQVFEASAWLEVKDQRPHVVFESHNDSKAFAETQLQTIKSPVVLMKVSSQAEIASLRERPAQTTLEWLEKGLKASFLGRSELCQISFRAHNADSAMKVANAIVDAYLSLHQDAYGQQVERIIELLVEERDRRKAEVEELRERVRVVNKKASGQDAATSSRRNELVVRENPVVGLEARRTEAEVERAVLEAKLQAYQEAADPSKVEVAGSEVDQAIAESIEVQSLRERLAVTRARLKAHDKASSRGEKDPLRKNYQQEINELESALADVSEQMRPRLLSDLRTAHAAEHSQMIVGLQAEIKKQSLLQDAWQKRLDEHRKKMQVAGDDTLELEFARQELARAEDVFDKIGDRLIVLKTEKRAPPQAMALQRAVKPELPIETRPYKKLGAAFLGGLFAPFALAFVWERSLKRISDSRQLVARGTPPVVGEITVLPTRWSMPGTGSDDRFLRDRITFEESIDSLSVALMLSADFREVQTLAVTSAVSREGKTSLASSLAMSLARRSRQPTLLVDADLRAPDLHDLFQVPLEPGLVDVLDDRFSVEESIVRDVARGIDLLPAGKLTKNAHAALRYEELQAFLAQARTSYRYIVLDAPPVLAASEALLIAASADGALVCAMRDVSRAAQFQLTCQKLGAAGARLLGTVMSGVPTRTWAQKYGGYGYGWNRYSQRSLRDGSEPAEGRQAHEDA